jgi:hypothetical protein
MKKKLCLITSGNMSAVRQCAEQCGSHWFDKNTLRFFRSRVGDAAFTDGRGGAYFVSSEQFNERSPRLYSIRYYDPKKCNINTVGKFQQYASNAAATRVAQKIAAKSRTRRRGYRMEQRPEWTTEGKRVVKHRRLQGSK